VDFKKSSKLLQSSDFNGFFDTLVDQLRLRNPNAFRG